MERIRYEGWHLLEVKAVFFRRDLVQENSPLYKNAFNTESQIPVQNGISYSNLIYPIRHRRLQS